MNQISQDLSNITQALNDASSSKSAVNASNDISIKAVSTDQIFKLSQTSIQGHSHKKSLPQVPCQDYGRGGILNNGFHVVLVSDGAGSSKHSHIASELCVNTLYTNLELFDFNEFNQKPVNLDEINEKWNRSVKKLLEIVRSTLIEFANKNKIPHDELNCTLLMVIKTDWGFLSANIGDGRSGFSDGTPRSLTVPFMTYTVGATYFLIKDNWDKMFKSYITLVEDPTKIKYFFATSDGCQDFVMDHSKKGPKTGIYDELLGDNAFYDYNIPYEPFFDGLILSLDEVNTLEERNLRLRNLVEFGIYKRSGEEIILKTINDPLLDDDKTLIIFHR